MTRFLPFGSRSRVIQINSLGGGGGGGVPRDGLVAEYLLATNSLDTSGNGYDGVDTAVTYNGTYATYNGSANTAVATDLYLTQNFSTSFWYSPISTSGVQYLWANSNSGGSEEGMYFNSGTLNYNQRFTSGYSTISTGATGLTNGVWYYVTAMTTTTGLELYINGTLVASNATTGTVQKFSPLGLFIGDNGFLNNSNINVKKFRIYDRVLNAGEIAALYADS